MSHIKVAIVDNQKLFRKGMISLVNQFKGIDVIIEAKNGKDLIDQLRKNKPDVILLDLKMPKVDGFEAAMYVRSKYPQMKIIVLTMFDDTRFIIHMLELEVNGYLLKNVEPEEVEKAILSVCRKGFYLNDLMLKVMRKNISIKDRAIPNFGFQISLSSNELKVLKLICKKYSSKEIAEKLYFSKRTIDGYKQKLFKKTNVKNTIGLVIYALKNKLVDLDLLD